MLFVLAFAVALNQYVICGKWFEIKDVHHEMFIVALSFAGLVVLWWKKGKLY